MTLTIYWRKSNERKCKMPAHPPMGRPPAQRMLQLESPPPVSRRFWRVPGEERQGNHTAEQPVSSSSQRTGSAAAAEDFFSRQESGRADHTQDSGAPVYTSQDQSGPMSGRRIQFDDTLHEFFGANAVPPKKISRREERQRARMGDTTMGLEREKLKKAKGKGSLDIVRGTQAEQNSLQSAKTASEYRNREKSRRQSLPFKGKAPRPRLLPGLW